MKSIQKNIKVKPLELNYKKYHLFCNILLFVGMHWYFITLRNILYFSQRDIKPTDKLKHSVDQIFNFNHY